MAAGKQEWAVRGMSRTGLLGLTRHMVYFFSSNANHEMHEWIRYLDVYESRNKMKNKSNRGECGANVVQSCPVFDGPVEFHEVAQPRCL